MFLSFQILQLSFVGVLSYSVFVSSTPLPSSCKDPATTVLENMWKNLNTGNILALLAEQTNGLKQTTLNGEKVYGERSCPVDSSMLQSAVDSSLYHRSTCPYYYVTRVNQTYYPRERTEANCRCTKCLEEKGPSGTQVCEPVTLPVKMLRRTTVCVDGLWKYESFIKHIPVSCTCAVARVHENSATISPPNDEPISM